MIPDPTLDQWLTANHTALINALDEVLDLDAGLADAILPTHYDTLTAGLDHVLDLDAGLHDIQSIPTTSNRVAEAASLTDYARHVAALPAHERLATRTWFPQRELTALQSITVARNGVRSLQLALAHAFDIARNITFASDIAHGIARSEDIARACALARKHALGRAPVLADVSGLARELAHDIDTTFELPLDINSGRLLKRAVELARALEAVHNTIVDSTGLRLRIVTNVLASSLADILMRAGTFTRQDLDAALPQLEQALTDATGADLTHANLDEVPLDGVLWSADTRWPSHLREQIRRDSVPIGPDLFQINPPRGTGKNTFVDQNL